MQLFEKFSNTLPLPDVFSAVFKKADGQLKLVGGSDSGVCVCVCLISKENGKKTCYIANIGDTEQFYTSILKQLD